MSTQSPVPYRYYPRLSSVVSENDIPDILGFIKTGIVNLLDHIYFKDFQQSKSPNGDSAFYGLSIVSKVLKIEIPGTGINLVLNPDLSDEPGSNYISVFPITIEYQWKILAYLRFFSVGNFSFDLMQIFEVALRILNITEEQAIAHFVNTFVEPEDQNITPLQQFVKDINEVNDWNMAIPTEATTLPQVVEEIFNRSAGKYASLVAFGTYLSTNDLEETSAKVKVYFRTLIPQDIDEFIKDVILPKFRATLLLSAAIEFPRNILKPVYREGTPDVPFEVIPPYDDQGNPKVTLSFAEAFFYADTEKGFGYNLDLVLNTNYPAMIGNTGLIIDIQNLKIDLSKTENIAEADADGRPKEFMGVYMEYTEIFLPKKWFKKNPGQTIGISANHLLVGTGGISGNIAVRATYKTEIVDNKTKVVSYFQEWFDLQYPVKVKNEDSLVIIGNHNDLLQFINTVLESPSQLKFEYPISLKLKGTDEYKEFKTETAYYQFQQSLPPVINPDNYENNFIWFDLGKPQEPGTEPKSKHWRLGFRRFDIDFYHGQVVHSSLHASLEIKKFKQLDDEGNPTKTLYIDLQGEWVDKDDFRLSAAFLSEEGGLEIPIFKSLILTLQTAELGKSDGVFYIGADTKISFPPGSLAADLFKSTEIDLPALRIYANGKLEFAGGTSFIPVNFNLPLGPIDMSVKGLHLGSVQMEFNGVIRDYNYIGFDGAMSIDPIGVDVTGNGVKYYYTTDNDKYGDDGDSFFHISRLDLDLIIPGNVSESKAVAIIKGSLTIPDPGVSPEYAGSVSVKIPKAKISGFAAMKFYPKYSAFYIDAGLELPTPIPLGPIGIFGFRGLIGQKYVAEKESIGMDENNTWYDYYIANPRGLGMDKFSTPPKTLDYSNPFSVGIGASIAIVGGERIASLRAMMLLSIPSVFMIDAGLTILSEKLGLAEEDPRNPPFFAMIAIGDDSFEFGAGADFGLNKTKRSFIDIHAEIHMGFFFRNQRPWYINFGTREKPITASLLKDIFNIKASAFLMIAAKGIETGAKVSFDINLLGMFKLWAIIEVGAHVSFERPQIGGFIYLEGGAELELFIAKFGFMLAIYLSLEMVKPFLIFAQFKIRIELRLGFGFFSIKLKFTLTITLKWEKNNTIDAAPIAPLTIEAVTNNPDFIKDRRVDDFVKGIHMLTNEEFKLDCYRSTIPNPNSIERIIPLDTFLDIKLEKGVVPSLEVDSIIGGHTGIANNCIEKIPPKREQPGGYSLRQVIHKYSIEKIEVKAWNAGSGVWENYNPYKAMFNEEQLDNLRIGQWQRNNDQYDTIRILGTTPFSFMDSGEPGWFIPEEYGITPSELFCRYEVEEKHRSNFLNIPLGTVFYPPTQYPAHLICDAYYTLDGIYTESFEIDDDGNLTQVLSEDKMIIRDIPNPFVQEGSNLPYNRSLEFGNFNNLIITPPDAIAKGQLLLTTYATGVTIEYYRKTGATTIKPKYDKIGEIYKTKQQLASPVEFNISNLGNHPISQIRIIPDTHNKNRINEILEEITQIYYIAELRVNGSGMVILTPQEQAALNLLEAELENLRKTSCSDVGCKDLPFEVLDLFGGSDTFIHPNQIVNDEISYYSFFEEISDFTPPSNINFNDYSIVLALISSTFIENDTTEIKKVIDFKDELKICVQNNEERNNEHDTGGGEANRGFFTWAIIKIEKIPIKPVNVIKNGDCGCSGNENPPFASVCTTSLQELNWITMTEYEYYQTIPGQTAINENTQAMMEAIARTIQPIWRPNTKYYLHFQLKDEVRINDEQQNNPGIFNYYYGFQTKGPLGHFHKQNPNYMKMFDDNGNPILDSNGEAKEYKDGEKAITSLRSYIDYKRSYPNADGNLQMSKPLFYGNQQCELNIYFDIVYTPQMFSEWYDYKGLGSIKGDMAIMIKDPVSDTIIPYPLPQDWEDEDVPKPKIEWEDDKDPRLPLSVQTVINYVEYIRDNDDVLHCDFHLGEAISPTTKFWTVKLTNLKPEKLYTALIYNAYDANGDGKIENQTETENGIEKIIYEENQKVHEYVFRTSRYQNFREQVMSYKLKELDDNGGVINEKQAVYEIRKADSSVWVNDLYALVSGSSTPRTTELEFQYLHEFDRALEGILELSPLDPPRNTEFIKILDDQSGDLIAILVRNPEPFSDPKMPIENIYDKINDVGELEEDGILQVIGTEGAILQYKILWNKDCSQAIIMHDTKKITANNLIFKFLYKTWDGLKREYAVKLENGVDDNQKLYTVVTEPIIFND